MSLRTCKRALCLAAARPLAVLALLAGGCAEKIEGPGNARR